MRNGRRHALRVTVIAGIVALLVAFARGVDWRAVVTVARAADTLLLAAALVCNLASLTLKGVRWWVFLKPLGVRSLSLVLRATFAGASLNNLLVAQGGEGARVLIVSRASGVSSAHVLAALAVERALDAVSYLVLLGGAAWLLPIPEHVARWRIAGSMLLLAATVALVALGVVARRPRRIPPAPPAPSVPSVPTYLRRFARGVAEVGSPRRIVLALVISFAAWALQVATYHLTVVAVHLPLPVAGSVAAMLAVGISFLVRATPGNVGVFQAVYALTVRSFGISGSDAVAAALLIQAVQVLPILLLGSLVTPRLGRQMVRSVDGASRL
ncbi:MAG: lysylphosphatidylglycerol synthase transmembrane domain-containing protein [Gemmatimonadaceae bacterium]